ncbi:MAG: Dabb family protein [Bacteroidales bacterium]
MLVHIVMWRFKDFAEGAAKDENAKKMKLGLEALVGVIPQLKYAQVGLDFKHTKMSYDAVLITHFNSEEDLAAYKIHPAHVAVSDFCKKIRESRVVCDYFI